jgi:transposase-like protein
LTEVVAEHALELRSKKHDRGWGRPNMRLPASEKLEAIYLVEQSHLPARRTLEMLGIKPSTFYRWYDWFRSGGPEALQDKPPKPDRVWNRTPDDIRQRMSRWRLISQNSGHASWLSDDTDTSTSGSRQLNLTAAERGVPISP